jgi:hypothetical protein
MKSLMAGFDVVSNHLGLILFSLVLDLFLWFGPRVRLAGVFDPIFEQAASLPEMQTAGALDSLRESLMQVNLLGVLRTFPIGVPSLMASRPPIETPINRPIIWDIYSLVSTAGVWFLLIITGAAVGTLYFSLVAQATQKNKLSISQAIKSWPRNFSQVLLLTIFCYFLIGIFLVPLSCVLTILLLLGLGFGQFPLLIALFFGGIVVWILIPLFFSPHGIFTHQRPMWDSILQGIRLSRATFSTTGLLILIVVLLSEGLNILWNMPPENSWFLLVGIIGHAFVTAALLAATFVYYRDADLWLKELVRQRELIQA